MPHSNRRRFLKTVGQGTLAADVGLGLPGSARPNAAQDTKNDNLTWPYPIAYDKETEVDVDVVVLGGGVAGCWAAIGAARKGLKVALVEKGNPIRSGCNGGGVDHWQWAMTNPASRVAPDELAQDMIDSTNGYMCGISRYIKTHEGWDRLQELEKMGMKIRDDTDQFKGAECRDEASKLLFAYNYQDRTVIRIWGTGLKPALTRECQRLGVKIFDRVMATSLLSQNGRPGSRIVGATGVNTRTGEFLIFKAKATIYCSQPLQGVAVCGQSGHINPSIFANTTSPEPMLRWPHDFDDFSLQNAKKSRIKNLSFDVPGIYVGSLDSSVAARLTRDLSNAAYTTSSSGAGYMLFVRGRSLLAQPFDVDHLRLTGEPVVVDDNVWYSKGWPLAAYSVSQSGVLVFGGRFDTGITPQFNVTPDGQRFLISVPMSADGSSPATVILNWTAALKK